jgi:hypothetical protein
MKVFLLAFCLSVGMVFNVPFAEAHGNSYRNSLDYYLQSAHRYPNQLQAAMIWRINNSHINLSSNSFALRKKGWHPSVIAVIRHPDFYSFAYNQPQFRKQAPRIRKTDMWNNRRFSTQPFSNFDQRFNQRRRSVRRNYCR